MKRDLSRIDMIIEAERQRAERGAEPREVGVTPSPAIESVAAFKVVQEADDYVTCHAWNGVVEGEAPIAVAKPPTLRGATATRTVSSVEQMIFPEYVAGDVIYAMQIGGGTDVDGVIWIDLNIDSRVWSEECGP